MKFIVIADTHGYHQELELPQGDVLLHAGDITDRGTKGEIIDFLDWFASQDYEHKIFIGGNHDLFLDDYPVELLKLLPVNVIYLKDSGCKIKDLQLWGSPVSPDLVGWAFGKERWEMADHWKYLPSKIDILITHTPPFGILDTPTSSSRNLGCEALFDMVQFIEPSYHLFGHIHASYGKVIESGTTFINASNMNSYMGLVNPPVVFEV